MHTNSLEHYQHQHTFGQDRKSVGESRTLIVTLLTAVFMVVEITAGVVYGSMALLADGLHMASHALALGIAVAAYVYARRRAGDARFSFGTGKVNALGGFTGALLLAVFAALMAWESVGRLIKPVVIVFDQAIAVAIVGLLVNGISVALLGVHSHDHGDGHEHHGEHSHDHGDKHDLDGDHSHDPGDKHDLDGDHSHDHDHGEHHGDGHDEHHDHSRAHDHGDHNNDQHDDHNLRSAYLHVLADALTSFFAIFALLGGKFFGLNWLDPVMGIVGSLLVASWSWGLLRRTSRVLLDYQAPAAVQARVKAAVEVNGDRVSDLHVWSIGPGVFASEIAIVTHNPLSPAEYKARLPKDLKLEHVSVEVHHCAGELVSVE
ncbi:MAG: cation transporter [Planctomycetes bacterium]|nr:cation transporter [Planctomycetota bacterium]